MIGQGNQICGLSQTLFSCNMCMNVLNSLSWYNTKYQVMRGEACWFYVILLLSKQMLYFYSTHPQGIRDTFLASSFNLLLPLPVVLQRSIIWPEKLSSRGSLCWLIKARKNIEQCGKIVKNRGNWEKLGKIKKTGNYCHGT